MNRWTKNGRKFGLTQIHAIFALVFFLVIGSLVYFVWTKGIVSIIGIPVQLLLVTLILPGVLAVLLFWFARIIEELLRMNEDE